MSWKPKALSAYSQEQLQKIDRHSTAFSRYRNIINSKSEDFGARLRQLRLRSWCKVVAEIYINNAPPQDVCKYWSSVADQIIEMAWRHFKLDKTQLACFGLGKLGSNELNLSSDIDLVLLSQNPCPKEVEQKVRQFTRILSDNTQDGFCFRVDYDLRPGGRFAPLVSSLPRAEDHYWTQGQTWERLALVRARPLCGNKETISSAEELFQSFIYRKYINYSLFEDLKNLRSDIFQFRPAPKEDSFHLKLADGGIRDIELFVHALQVIHGGRVDSVRKIGTSDAVQSLIDSQCGDTDDLKFLNELYWQLRDAENRCQAKEDSQIHILLKSDDESLFQSLSQSCEKAASIVSDILGKVNTGASLPHEVEKQKNWLKDLGFNKDSIENVWPSLIGLTARSTRFSHDEEARQRVLKLFVERLSKGNDPDLGLSYLSDFIKSIRAKSSFFSLLLHEQKLVDDLSQLFTSSPTLSQIFVNRPELLDSFVFNLSEPSSSDDSEVLESLFEKKLLADVRYSMEFLRDSNVNSLVRSLSDLADQTFSDLFNHLKKEHSSNLEVLRMGKWAGRELGLRSDLDLVLVSPEDVNEVDYKLARRLISRVTENHKGGHFYQIDLRLRPTGSAGPLIMSHKSLLEYLKNRAEPWEVQSYLRARFDGELNGQIKNIVLNKKFNGEQLKSLKGIRKKLYKNPTDKIDLKYGEGGLLDIEFSAQIACIQNSISYGSCNTNDLLISLKAHDLAQSYNQLRMLEQSLQLLTERATSTLGLESKEFQRLSDILKREPQELYQWTQKIMTDATKQLKALDPIWSSD